MPHIQLNSPEPSSDKLASLHAQASKLPLPLRYLIVGGTAYVVEMFSLWVLGHRFGLRPVAAVAVSFWIGFIVAFILQKLITFQNYDKGKRALARQLTGYAALVAINYGFTLLAVSLLQHFLPVAVVRTGVIAITTVWNYMVYKWLFKA